MTQAPLWIVSRLVMVGVLVILHEAGHFLFARLFGVGTPIFSIGLGPRLFGFRAWETDFRVSLLPIGAKLTIERAADGTWTGELTGDDVKVTTKDAAPQPILGALAQQWVMQTRQKNEAGETA